MKIASWVLPIIVTGLVAGCGSETVHIPAPVQPVPVEQATPTTPEKLRDGDAESNASAPIIADTNPDALAKQTEAHAKAIEDLLNAQNQADMDQRGVVAVGFTPDKTATDQQPVTKTQPAPVKQQPVRVVAQSPEITSQNVAGYVPPINTATSANTPVSIVPQPDLDTVTKIVRPSQSSGFESSSNQPFEQKLAARANEYPRDLASQMDYQLALFLKDETVPRAADVANLAPEDRELLTALMDGLSNFRSTIRTDNNMLMNRKIRPLIEMTDRLRSRSDLSIPFATLCTEVKSYGVFTPYEQLRFEAGMPIKAVVYAEVENISAQMNDKSLWQTHLTEEITLYTESGMNVWTQKEKFMDVCRNRRRDFFTCPKIIIKDNLTLGRYLLKVSITDEQAGRIAETSIPIAVVAKQ